VPRSRQPAQVAALGLGGEIAQIAARARDRRAALQDRRFVGIVAGDDVAQKVVAKPASLSVWKADAS